MNNGLFIITTTFFAIFILNYLPVILITRMNFMDALFLEYIMATDLASDFSKYLHHDIHNKLSPINRMIEDMLARLEEFETMVNFVTLDVNESTDALSSLTNFNEQLLELFSKVDIVEKVINHLKGNLNMLELDIQKAEQRLKLNNDNKLVTNIITPLLFRKTTEKKKFG